MPHTQLHTVTNIKRLLCCAGLTIALLPNVIFAQLTSTSFELDVNGVGEAGIGNTQSTNFGADSNAGPTFYVPVTESETEEESDSGSASDATRTNRHEENSDLEVDENGTVDSSTSPSQTDLLEDLVAVQAPTAIPANNPEKTTYNPGATTDVDSPNYVTDSGLIETASGNFTSGTDVPLIFDHDFADGAGLSVTILPSSILESNGEPLDPELELTIILTEENLPPELLPAYDLQADHVGGVLFTVTIVDKYGIQYEKFTDGNTPMVDVHWADDVVLSDDMVLYKLSSAGNQWLRVEEAIFLGSRISFPLIKEGALFGAWSVAGQPPTMPLESSVGQNDVDGPASYIDEYGVCTSQFWIFPLCKPWPWIYFLCLLGLFLMGVIGRLFYLCYLLTRGVK